MTQVNTPKAQAGIVPLKRGGHLAYSEYGNRGGLPVFFFHGWPSSRTMAELTDVAARELGIWIISPDRPGISESTFQQNRSLLDWPEVLGALADHLQIGQFHALGFSGGAPYAFVVAWAMPERVRAIAVASGAPPIAELRDQSGLLPLYRQMLLLDQKHPALLRALFYLVRPFARFRLPFRYGRILLNMLQPCDAEALKDAVAFQACFESQRRAWRGSGEGVLTDAQIYARPWRFRLEEINVPVRLWHGKQDRAFSLAVAQEVAARLPNCVARYIDNEGHYSLAIRRIREILADLIAI